MLNRHEVDRHTHGNYNCYEIQYPILFASDDVKSTLIVEMTYLQRAYPSELREADSYIGNFLAEHGGDAAVAFYDLAPFEVQVQTLGRTLIDKVFALCDYYLGGNMLRNSRHIYDIAKILPKMDMTDRELGTLAKQVRAERKTNKTCLSAKDGVSVPEILEKIIESSCYERDYVGTTLKLSTKPLPYREAIRALQAIINRGLFADSISESKEIITK